MPLPPASALQQLQTANLREQARAAIRTGIITGEIRAGKIHSARTLAEALGVSATPVREALLDLASEGLVTSVRNRGFQITDLSEHDLDEILELRLMLEVPAAGRAAVAMSADDVALLREMADRMEAAAAEGDLRSFLDTDLEFHLAIAGQLANRRLVELIRRLRDQTRLVGLGPLAVSGALKSTAAEHRAIVDAFAAGDAALAEALVRKHLQHTRGVWAGREEAVDAG
jgi:DNA-binding GntR family transcriptional regulator